MIPDKIMVRLSCDACGSAVSVLLDEDTIDSAGWDLALEGELIDASWGISERMTFCQHCMERAQALALQQLVRDAEHKGQNQKRAECDAV